MADQWINWIGLRERRKRKGRENEKTPQLIMQLSIFTMDKSFEVHIGKTRRLQFTSRGLHPGLWYEL